MSGGHKGRTQPMVGAGAGQPWVMRCAVFMMGSSEFISGQTRQLHTIHENTWQF